MTQLTFGRMPPLKDSPAPPRDYPNSAVQISSCGYLSGTDELGHSSTTIPTSYSSFSTSSFSTPGTLPISYSSSSYSSFGVPTNSSSPTLVPSAPAGTFAPARPRAILCGLGVMCALIGITTLVLAALWSSHGISPYNNLYPLLLVPGIALVLFAFATCVFKSCPCCKEQAMIHAVFVGVIFTCLASFVGLGIILLLMNAVQHDFADVLSKLLYIDYLEDNMMWGFNPSYSSGGTGQLTATCVYSCLFLFFMVGSLIISFVPLCHYFHSSFCKLVGLLLPPFIFATNALWVIFALNMINRHPLTRVNTSVTLPTPFSPAFDFLRHYNIAIAFVFVVLVLLVLGCLMSASCVQEPAALCDVPYADLRVKPSGEFRVSLNINIGLNCMFFFLTIPFLIVLLIGGFSGFHRADDAIDTHIFDPAGYHYQVTDIMSTCSHADRDADGSGFVLCINPDDPFGNGFGSRSRSRARVGADRKSVV